jgi:hypothetical protein
MNPTTVLGAHLWGELAFTVRTHEHAIFRRDAAAAASLAKKAREILERLLHTPRVQVYAVYGWTKDEWTTGTGHTAMQARARAVAAMDGVSPEADGQERACMIAFMPPLLPPEADLQVLEDLHKQMTTHWNFPTEDDDEPDDVGEDDSEPDDVGVHGRLGEGDFCDQPYDADEAASLLLNAVERHLPLDGSNLIPADRMREMLATLPAELPILVARRTMGRELDQRGLGTMTALDLLKRMLWLSPEEPFEFFRLGSRGAVFVVDPDVELAGPERASSSGEQNTPGKA